MNELQVLKYNENEIRTVIKDGQPWDVLGIQIKRETPTRPDFIGGAGGTQ